MNIREIRSDDLAAAVALNNANVPAVNELDASGIARLVSIGHVSLAAEADGVLAGFCIVIGPDADYASLNYQWFSRNYQHFAYLDRIVVDPQFRRFGIGRGLYAALADRLRDEFPVLLCEVNVRPRNDASLAFHHAIGFREVGQQDTDGGRKTVSLLELSLVEPHV